MDPERGMASRAKLVPMREQLIRNLTLALDGEKLALLAPVGGGINAIDDIAGKGRLWVDCRPPAIP